MTGRGWGSTSRRLSLADAIRDQLQPRLFLLLTVRVDGAGDEHHETHLGRVGPFRDELSPFRQRLLVAHQRTSREGPRLGDGARVHADHLEPLNHQVLDGAPFRAGGERRPKQVAVGVADTVALVAETPAVIVDEPGAVAPDDLDGLTPVGSAEGVRPGVSDGERAIAGGVRAGT